MEKLCRAVFPAHAQCLAKPSDLNPCASPHASSRVASRVAPQKSPVFTEILTGSRVFTCFYPGEPSWQCIGCARRLFSASFEPLSTSFALRPCTIFGPFLVHPQSQGTQPTRAL